jgi:hypothetical protein
MHVQFSGEIGPFLDAVQQRQVSVVVAASCKYASMGASGSAAQIEQQIQGQMLRAIHTVIAPKMASGQLSFKDLGTGNTASIVPEILATSGLGFAGIAVDRLVMTFGIDGHAPAPLPAAAAPAPIVAPVQHMNVRVGGFNVHASSGGGIDTAGLRNQLVDKAKSQLMWWAFGAGIMLIVVLGLAGLGYYIWSHASAPPPGAAVAAKWDGKSPLVCAGNSAMTVTGVNATLPGTAITASGTCSLTLVNVEVSGGTAIEAGGNSVVTVQGGQISGSTLAVHAAGNAKVTFAGTKVTGKTQAVALAKITGL